MRPKVRTGAECLPDLKSLTVDRDVQCGWWTERGDLRISFGKSLGVSKASCVKDGDTSMEVNCSKLTQMSFQSPMGRMNNIR